MKRTKERKKQKLTKRVKEKFIKLFIFKIDCYLYMKMFS